MTLKEKIETMQAFERGEEIEVSKSIIENWITEPCPNWNWVNCDYRIKPELKQVVVIEKWLCYDNLSQSHSIVEESNIDGYISDYRNDLSKVRLLDTNTYEVEL